MKTAVDTGLKRARSPIEWAILADGILYTAQIPMRADGSIEDGDIGAQTTLTLANLRRTIAAAGGTLADVTQVLVYLPHPGDFPGMNAVYQGFFPQPYPNRATIVANLMVAGARIEIVAYAHIGHKAGASRRAKAAKTKTRTRAKARKAATGKAKAKMRSKPAKSTKAKSAKTSRR